MPGSIKFNSYWKVLIKNPTILIYAWSFASFTMFNFLESGQLVIIKDCVKPIEEVIYTFVVTLPVLSFPVIGCVTDTYFGRYKVIKISLIVMWMGSILVLFPQILKPALSDSIYNIAASISKTICMLGCIGFQTNILQFGFDQLIDSSATDLVKFCFSYMCVYYISSALNGLLQCSICCDFFFMSQLLVPFLMTFAVLSDLVLNHILVKEPRTHNPIKLIFKVLRYAAKNKHPRMRSAFTYWEDKPYSRIDVGKVKYGGPFTTEQVEDVKTFFRVIGLISVACIFVSITAMPFLVSCISFWYSFWGHSNFTENCLKNYVYYYAGPIFIIASFLLWCIFIRFCFMKWLHKLTAPVVCFIGISFMLLGILELILLEQLTSSGTCASCKIKNLMNQGFDTNRMRLFSVLAVTYSLGGYLVASSGITFVCAQVPYSMKGLVFGFSYSCLVVTMLLAYYVVFGSFQMLNASVLKLCCMQWYFLCCLMLAVICYAGFVVVAYFYKKRLREDHLPNQQYFAEQYYDTLYNSTADRY